MKKPLYLFLVLLTASFSFLWGCGDDEEIGPDDVSDIVSGLIFATGVDTQTITFTTNKKWVATVSSLQGDASWCSISPSSGAAGTANIRVSTTDNTGQDERSAIITIETGNTVKTVSIYQKGRKVVHVDTPGTLEDLLGSDYSSIRELTITGTIHGDDVRTIHQMSRLQYLDISEVLIVKGGAHYETIAKTISSRMFYGLYLRAIILPNSVTSIGDYAFCRCKGLTSVIIPNSVTSIEDHAFNDCTSLTSVTIPNSVTSIGWSAFGGCTSLTSVTIPNSVTSIEAQTFINCTSLTSVTIPNSVTSITMEAFYNCTSLTSVTIGSGIKSMGYLNYYGPFKNCDKIEEVHIKATIPPSGDTGILNKSSIKLYVPKGSKEIYQNNYWWKGFYQYIEE